MGSSCQCDCWCYESWRFWLLLLVCHPQCCHQDDLLSVRWWHWPGSLWWRQLHFWCNHHAGMPTSLGHMGRTSKGHCGALEYKKSYFYPIDYKYQKGRWKYKSPGDVPGEILPKDDDTNTLRPIECLPVGKSRKALGITTCPDRRMSHQKAYMRQKAEEWGAVVNKEDAWYCLNATIVEPLNSPSWPQLSPKITWHPSLPEDCTRSEHRSASPEHLHMAPWSVKALASLILGLCNLLSMYMLWCDTTPEVHSQVNSLRLILTTWSWNLALLPPFGSSPFLTGKALQHPLGSPQHRKTCTLLDSPWKEIHPNSPQAELATQPLWMTWSIVTTLQMKNLGLWTWLANTKRWFGSLIFALPLALTFLTTLLLENPPQLTPPMNGLNAGTHYNWDWCLATGIEAHLPPSGLPHQETGLTHGPMVICWRPTLGIVVLPTSSYPSPTNTTPMACLDPPPFHPQQI